MKKIFSVLTSVFLALSLSACSGNSAGGGLNPENSTNQSALNSSSDNTLSSNANKSIGSSVTESDSENSSEPSGSDSTNITNNSTISESTPEVPSNSEKSNILVAYFSLADEQYEVGIIEKGNTQIIAEIIAEKTGADLFSITSTTAYPTTYDGLLDISRKEESDPPELAETVTNMDDYDTVFIGYPIWWGDLPTIVKVFLENHDFSGKTVIPFCTHAGSGLSGTQRSVESLCAGAEVRNGLAVRGTTAQNERGTAESTVSDWLVEIGING